MPDKAGVTVDELSDLPVLRPGVECFAPETPGVPWVARGADNKYFRLGPELANLINAVDGERSVLELCDELGDPWTEQLVRTGLLELSQKGMLDDDSRFRPKRGWFRFQPPLTFQITLIKPERLLKVIAPLVGLVANRIALVVGLGVVVGGLLSLVLQAGAIARVGLEPLPPSTLLWVFLASQVTIVVHELAHGAVLTWYGGHATRLGLMLFYLMPAMFCDVSDGWRMPRGSQRVHVALAGPVVQVVLATVAALVSAVVAGEVRNALLIYAIVGLMAGLSNLIPFVKLDGYIALMSHLDIPNLRSRSIADAKSALVSLLFGVERRDNSVDRSWSVPYGAVCLVFPILLIFLGFSIWGDFLIAMGLPGAVVLLLLVGYIGWMAVSGSFQVFRAAWTGGASPVRTVAVSLALVAGLGFALTSIQVPNTFHGRFVFHDDGAWLLVNHEANLDRISGEHTVTLKRRGVLFEEDRGLAIVRSDESETVMVPLRALVGELQPGDEVLVSTLAVPLHVTADPKISAGAAAIDLGETSMASWLYGNVLGPITSSLAVGG